MAFFFNKRRSVKALHNRMQSKMTIIPNSPIRTAHANLPMYVEEPLASDLEISLPRAFVVLERSTVRFLTRISMISAVVRLTHSWL